MMSPDLKKCMPMFLYRGANIIVMMGLLQK
uniref:Uncharacterized protein n=1 Tax=Siphoviridae sp. ctLqe90 TaxID=2825456 RepID=A0A8S5Q2Y4_9CAUD|nr:MAG TPA: hypothetical protein [Siphoviridae sp. ctLqe90]